MRAIIFGIMSQFTIALAVFVINRKLTTVNPFLLNFLLAGLGAALLLPVLWFNLSRPFFPDTQILGWILLSAFLFIALGETFYVLGIQAAEETRDLRPFALTA